MIEVAVYYMYFKAKRSNHNPLVKIEDKGKLWIAFELQEREKKVVNHLKDVQLEKLAVSYRTFNVTVLEAKLHKSKDYFSESDCYVILSLPTASGRTNRTASVSNSNNPHWNETFSYRIPTDVKNILELKLYDEDPMAPDDVIATVLFDLSMLSVGKQETKVFSINPETKDELLIRFELLQNEDPPCDYLSNGILLAAPFSALDINVEKLQSYSSSSGRMLTLRGASEENQPLHAKEEPKLRFHINRDLETEVGLTSGGVFAQVAPMESSTKLQPVAAKHAGKVSLLIDQDTVDLDIETHEGDKPLAVRLDFDIPQQEKEFVKKRRVLVGPALHKLLGLKSAPTSTQVPTIAVVVSGGGTRAMTGMLGSLKSLQETGLLDAVTYITGVSGSTWAMSTLHQDAHWSQHPMDAVISQVKKQVSKTAQEFLSQENLQYYREELAGQKNEGYSVSLVDMFGLFIERLIFGKPMSDTLSDQQSSVQEGQNPLPIYTAVNMKDQIEGCECEAEWCEFTPYEVGIPKYGAFVQAEDFGSQFFLGHLTKRLPELRLSSMLGIWSSALSVNLASLWTVVTGSEPPWTPWTGPNVSNTEVDTESSTLSTQVVHPITGIAGILDNFLKTRPVVTEIHNFMRGLCLHQEYNKHSNFKAWKDTHPDAFPNKLTPADSSLRLVDSGHSINIGCAPILRPERDVDVIISLSYSWDPDNILMVLENTAAYCTDHHIPFPTADFASLEKEPQKEFYVFEDEEDPKAPIVIHLPLVNDTYKHFKQPGVKRETEEEVKAGVVDVRSSSSPYRTRNMTYTQEDFEALVQLTAYNVMNNKERILESLRKAVVRKAAKVQK